MPRKITSAEIDYLWQTYEKIHGTQPITEEEVVHGVKLLLRTGGITAGTRHGIKVKFVSGRNQTRFIDIDQFNVNLTDGTDWQEIVHHVAWRCDGGSKGMEIKLARRACEGNFLVGALKPQPKVVVPPTKEEIRKQKVDRLLVRQEKWEKKIERAQTMLRKINRSLTAYRRYE